MVNGKLETKILCQVFGCDLEPLVFSQKCTILQNVSIVLIYGFRSPLAPLPQPRQNSHVQLTIHMLGKVKIEYLWLFSIDSIENYFCSVTIKLKPLFWNVFIETSRRQKTSSFSVRHAQNPCMPMKVSFTCMNNRWRRKGEEPPLWAPIHPTLNAWFRNLTFPP